MGESIGRVKAGAQRLASAHAALLKAELAVTGRDLGIIAVLVLGVIALVVLALLLIAIGGFLFLGEWLFGSAAGTRASAETTIDGLMAGLLTQSAVLAGLGLAMLVVGITAGIVTGRGAEDQRRDAYA